MTAEEITRIIFEKDRDEVFKADIRFMNLDENPVIGGS